jgi:hypothetical protein
MSTRHKCLLPLVAAIVLSGATAAEAGELAQHTRQVRQTVDGIRRASGVWGWVLRKWRRPTMKERARVDNLRKLGGLVAQLDPVASDRKGKSSKIPTIVKGAKIIGSRSPGKAHIELFGISEDSAVVVTQGGAIQVVDSYRTRHEHPGWGYKAKWVKSKHIYGTEITLKAIDQRVQELTKQLEQPSDKEAPITLWRVGRVAAGADHDI